MIEIDMVAVLGPHLPRRAAEFTFESIEVKAEFLNTWRVMFSTCKQDETLYFNLIWEQDEAGQYCVLVQANMTNIIKDEPSQHAWLFQKKNEIAITHNLLDEANLRRFRVGRTGKEIALRDTVTIAMDERSARLLAAAWPARVENFLRSLDKAMHQIAHDMVAFIELVQASDQRQAEPVH